MALLGAFLLSPIARSLGAAALGLGLVGFVYAKGYAGGVADTRLQVERASAAEQRRRQAIMAETLEAARERVVAARRVSEANRRRAEKLTADLAAREGSDGALPVDRRCAANPPLSVTDAEKLDAIR